MRFTFLFDFLLLIIKPKLKTTFNDLIILQFSKDKEKLMDFYEEIHQIHDSHQIPDIQHIQEIHQIRLVLSIIIWLFAVAVYFHYYANLGNYNPSSFTLVCPPVVDFEMKVSRILHEFCSF